LQNLFISLQQTSTL